ncbi:MAG: hydroxymethylbilane synthase [Alphaproteobacteria bacterium]
MSARAPLRIGTRGSPLARYQAEAVRGALIAAHAGLAEPGAVAIAIIKTTGDKVRDRALADIGGKGLFTKEIEQALLAGAIDMAVHSMKDVPTWLPDGLAIACLLAREDPRDALVAKGAASISALAEGAVVGTASVRRKAQLLSQRPDLEVVLFRGNVDTRLRKLAAGEVDATLLALAGLKRLGVADEAGAVPLDPSEMLPAAGQGAIGVECRAADARVLELLASIDHAPTGTAIAAERALLAALHGSCRTPIAALAELGDDLHLRALVAKPDGSAVHATERRGSASEAAALGADAGRALRAAAGPGFFDAGA